ncbi:MAG: hypothetical protein ACKOAF_09705 [Actinomycetes bacterium]
MRETGRLRGIIVKAITASALILGTVGIAAVPAQAAQDLTLTGVTNGPQGALQNLTITDSTGTCGSTLAQQMQVLGSTNGGGTYSVIGYATYVSCSGNNDLYQYQWLPAYTGTWLIQASNGPDSSNTATAVIGGTTTLTTIAAPNVATVGVATKVQVNVTSQGQAAYAPTGTVVVKDGSGNTVATMGLTKANAGSSYAYWWWTPPTTGTYAFTAYYGGDSVASASQSATDLVLASVSGNTITLLAPGTMTVGLPVTLTATVVPANMQGSVGFTFNGKPISASIPIVNGSASMQWTPTTAGAAVMGASYTTNGGASGSTTDKVNIVAGPVQQDVITLTQPGWGTWAPNGQYNLPNGTSTTMTASTLSGSPVTLTETGPCSVSGLTITVPVASGQCNIQASSPGGKGYGPVTYGYTVLPGLGNQTATLAAPLSGKLTKGRTYVLESPGQVDTNAGQNITWTVTKGNNSVCKIGYPADGSVTLKMLKKGACNIKGTAPGVPNQWNPYVVTRSYKG